MSNAITLETLLTGKPFSKRSGSALPPYIIKRHNHSKLLPPAWTCATAGHTPHLEPNVGPNALTSLAQVETTQALIEHTSECGSKHTLSMAPCVVLKQALGLRHVV
jgi:hypothetical protein